MEIGRWKFSKRDQTFTDCKRNNLEPSLASIMKLFCKNIYRILVVNYFRKNVPLKMFDWVLKMPLGSLKTNLQSSMQYSMLLWTYAMRILWSMLSNPVNESISKAPKSFPFPSRFFRFIISIPRRHPCIVRHFQNSHSENVLLKTR